jgi:hypothetical protein
LSVDVHVPDTGIGIVSSLKEILNTTKKEKIELLSKSVEKVLQTQYKPHALVYG